MNKMKKIIALVCALLVVNNCNNAVNCFAKSINNEKKEAKKIKTNIRINENELSENNRKKIEKAKLKAKKDASASAQLLNSYNDDLFLVGVDSILDYYYENNEDERIEMFEQELDERADEIIRQYSKAKEERDRENELEYATSSIIATFDKDISSDIIKDVVSDQNSECIILDEEYPIYSKLSPEKKEKIKKVLKNIDDRIAIIETTNRQTVKRAINDYKKYNVFNDVETSYKSEVEGYTNDTYSNYQTPFFDKINASSAWNLLGDKGSEEWVAVIDTGVCYTHEDIKMNILDNSYDIMQDCYLDESTQPYLGDHGTHVAGIIAASANNSKGIAGIGTVGDNSRCKILAVQASHNEIENGRIVEKLYDSDIIKGIYYSIVNGADVINLSLGTFRDDYDSSSFNAFQHIINIAYLCDIPVVAATGNKGKYCDNFYPAAFAHVIGVGSCGLDGQKSSFSNYGSMVDVCAVGEDVKSLVNNSDRPYSNMSGTSMATPMVSATIALMKSITYNNISCNHIEYNLQKTAYGNGIRLNDGCGYGLINCGLAVQRSKNDLVNPTYEYSIEKVLFDTEYYADSNFDLKHAYGYNKYNLYNHWKNYGRYEGRGINIAFDLAYYLNNNIDLKNVYGSNYYSAFLHFIRNGYLEYRPMSLVFNCRYYKDYNSDLRSMTSYELIQHFIYNGIYEGRRACDTFDPKEYVCNYSYVVGDLHQANEISGSASWKESYMHYILLGYNQGLSGRLITYK